MPTYEYVCEKCGHQFERFQPISAKPLSVCPEDQCAQRSWGKGKVKRAISGGAGNHNAACGCGYLARSSNR